MRLFLAIELDEAARRGITTLGSELEGRVEGWRWLRPEGVHLTLRFLGDVSDQLESSHRPAWRRAAAAGGPVRFEIGGLGVFPPRGTPRVLWTGVRGLPGPEPLAQLATALEEAARGEGFRPERRPFRPHLTIARAARGQRPTRPAANLSVNLGEVAAPEVVLFRSELAPGGARYTVMERFPLGTGHRREDRS